MKTNWLRPSWPQNNDPFDDGKNELRPSGNRPPPNHDAPEPIYPKPIPDPGWPEPDLPDPPDPYADYPETPPIKVFFIGGHPEENSQESVYEYTKIFNSRFLYNNILSHSIIYDIGMKVHTDTEVKFLTPEELQKEEVEKATVKYDNPYVAIIGHGWGARRALLLVQKFIKLNTLILIDPITHGRDPKKDFNTVLSKIDKEHFKVKFINFTDYKLDWTPSSGDGNAASVWFGRWDVPFREPITIGQGNSDIYRKLTQLGYSKYDLLSKIKCNHADFCVMFKQCEDWLLNDIKKFIKKAYEQHIINNNNYK